MSYKNNSVLPVAPFNENVVSITPKYVAAN